jgi:hypothetical protein
VRKPLSLGHGSGGQSSPCCERAPHSSSCCVEACSAVFRGSVELASSGCRLSWSCWCWRCPLGCQSDGSWPLCKSVTGRHVSNPRTCYLQLSIAACLIICFWRQSWHGTPHSAWLVCQLNSPDPACSWCWESCQGVGSFYAGHGQLDHACGAKHMFSTAAFRSPVNMSSGLYQLLQQPGTWCMLRAPLNGWQRGVLRGP